MAWGGIDVRLDAPGPDPSSAVATSAAESSDSEPLEPEEVELGPLLLLGTRTGGEVELVPIGHILDGELFSIDTDAATRVALSDRVTPGRSFTLFAEGARVGTLFATGAGRSTAYCGERPVVTGVLEATDQAVGVQRFLALDADYTRVAHGPYLPLEHTRDERVASLDLMIEIIPQIGATWPPGSVLEMRRDIQIFQLDEGAPPTIAATFVYQDALRTGTAPANSYSVFLLGQDSGVGYRPTFVSYRPFDELGKGSPQYFDRIDWDADGEDEVVLEVFGVDETWVSVLDRVDGVWREAYHDPCGLSTLRSEVAP